MSCLLRLMNSLSKVKDKLTQNEYDTICYNINTIPHYNRDWNWGLYDILYESPKTNKIRRCILKLSAKRVGYWKDELACKKYKNLPVYVTINLVEHGLSEYFDDEYKYIKVIRFKQLDHDSYVTDNDSADDTDNDSNDGDHDNNTEDN